MIYGGARARFFRFFRASGFFRERERDACAIINAMINFSS